MDKERQALLKVQSDYFYQRTCKVIPNGVQTLSKMPSKHVSGIYPMFIERASGAYVYDGDNNRYVDFPCGLGSIVLGYANGQVNEAVKARLDDGVLFSLPNKLETELAEKICEIIPSAEMVRFLKTGSEATSAAIKIARAYSGKGNILCCGYHGWHNWYNWTTPKNKGARFSGTYKFKYNDIHRLTKLLRGTGDVAAIIMEPYVLEEPQDGFLQGVRKLCDETQTVLIFDEVVTGFRTEGLSAQAMYGVTPDLTCIGKAMANGLPISAVCGRADIMRELEGDCFVSSTFGGELASIVAALETIKIIQTKPVIKTIYTAGRTLKDAFNEFFAGYDATCIGHPNRTFFKFPTEAHKALFWQECLMRGVFFGYAQFTNYAHKPQIMKDVVSAMRLASQTVIDHWDAPENAVEGKIPEETFRLVVT